jgi:N-acyl-D-amino-acid deacylase
VLADSARSYCVTSIMREDDVRAALADPLVSVCTDAMGLATDGPLAAYGNHPRAFGTFPRILGRYVREEHLLRLEEAIRKMTSQPAHRAGLADRGLLRPGMAADVVAFDPATIRDVATYESPRQYAIGIRHVFVNGRPVVRDGRITDERPGRVLRGPGWRARPRSD